MKKRTEADKVTVLVLGASGQIGTALRNFWSQPHYEGELCQVASLHEAVDISNKQAIREQISCVHPDVVINCAGYTDSRTAEANREECWRTNVLGVSNIVDCCVEQSIDLVHLSSDFLFGLDNTPLRRLRSDRAIQGAGLILEEDEIAFDPRYTEKAPAAPIGHLAMTKLAAEHKILQAATDEPAFRSWIIRTACVFESPWRRARNFPYSIAAALSTSNATIPVASDVHTSICFAPELAKVIAWLVEHRNDWFPRGVYNIANVGGPSLYEVAYRIATTLRYPYDRVQAVTVQEIEERQAKQASRELRRHYTVLNTSQYEELKGPDMSPWEVAIDEWCSLAAGQF